MIASQTGKSLYGNAVTGSRKCGLWIVSRSKISGKQKEPAARIMAVLMQFMPENSTGIMFRENAYQRLQESPESQRKNHRQQRRVERRLTIYAVSRNQEIKESDRGNVSIPRRNIIVSPFTKQKKGTDASRCC